MLCLSLFSRFVAVHFCFQKITFFLFFLAGGNLRRDCETTKGAEQGKQRQDLIIKELRNF